MQTSEIDYLDGEHTITESEPSTIQELIDMIGEEAVVENVNSNLRYRNKYPRVYGLVSKAVAERHSYPRAEKERKQNKDGSEKIILVSEMDHLRAFEAESDENKQIVQALFEEIAPEQPLYVKGERTGGGGKISQQAMDAANGFFAQGDDVVEEKIGFIESAVPGYKVARDANGNATPESVARGIGALNNHLKKQAAKQAAAMLSGGAKG